MPSNKQEQLNQQEKKSFESVLVEVQQKRKDAYKRDVRETHAKIIEFAHHLREKYPDCEERLLFHILIGSSPKPDAIIKEDDFPDEDSIIKFIENL